MEQKITLSIEDNDPTLNYFFLDYISLLFRDQIFQIFLSLFFCILSILFVFLKVLAGMELEEEEKTEISTPVHRK